MPTTESPLPRFPVLDWGSFRIVHIPGIASIEDLTYRSITTSGRAAIYCALEQLRLPPGSTVLVPSYHCPTMVAPVLLAKLNVAYFGIQADGLPKLDTIAKETASKSKAMIVSHYFGIGRSLSQIRSWCDDHNIALIEDCAHCFFGTAGDRPVGAWGDYSTASLTKFLPVPEGGLLASAYRPIANLGLAPQGVRAQLKGCIDTLELASIYKRFSGINSLLSFIFWLKNSRQQTHPNDKHGVDNLEGNASEATEASMMQDCDMARVTFAPLWATKILNACLPRGRIVARRQRNFACYARRLIALKGATPIFALSATQIAQNAPYVFPLWVDDADRVYHALRAQSLPVFRWNRIWPGTPMLAGDVGPLWSHHVLQLLCHQDLNESDIELISDSLLKLLRN
jgi:perosamine synthetase